MSEETNQWRKRSVISVTCPSGTVCQVRRPGPDLALRGGKIARILRPKNGDGFATDPDKQLELIEKLNEEEFIKVMLFAREVVLDVVIQPRLVRSGDDQLTPDDLPVNDFWYLFTWAMNGGPDMPVKLDEGETTVEAVETFPSGQVPGSDVSDNGQQVQSTSV